MVARHEGTGRRPGRVAATWGCPSACHMGGCTALCPRSAHSVPLLIQLGLQPGRGARFATWQHNLVGGPCLLSRLAASTSVTTASSVVLVQGMSYHCIVDFHWPSATFLSLSLRCKTAKCPSRILALINAARLHEQNLAHSSLVHLWMFSLSSK